MDEVGKEIPNHPQANHVKDAGCVLWYTPENEHKTGKMKFGSDEFLF